MAGLCQKKHHLFLRITSVLTLILLIGLWESKVQRNLKRHRRHLGQNLSQHININQHDTENLLVLHQMEKMEVLHKVHLQMNKKLMLGSFCSQGIPIVIQIAMKLLILSNSINLLTIF